jgi:hypothetical protein
LFVDSSDEQNIGLFFLHFADNPFYQQNASRNGGNLQQANRNRGGNQRRNLLSGHSRINSGNILPLFRASSQR